MSIPYKKSINKNNRFVNSEEFVWPTAGEYISSLWEWLFGNDERVPKNQLPQYEADIAKFVSGNLSCLKSIWLGHSSVLINIDGYIILTDPLLVRYATFLGPVKFNKQLPLPFENVAPIDAVIISHNHHDHLNAYTIKKIKEKVKRFCVPLGVGSDLIKWGITKEKISEFDWWDEIEINDQLTIAAAPAQHFSGRRANDRDKTLWASWVIKTSQHKIFFSGDSGYSSSFKDIGAKYGPFEVTFMECGAYDKRWHHIHMYPEETVQAHIDLHGKYLHPIHWGTFNLSLHSWYEPVERLLAEVRKHNTTAVIPRIGELINYYDDLPKDKWWRYLILPDEL